MVISLKDGLKLFGIIIVAFCAVFVCTFFLNFYMDAVAIKDTIIEAQKTLYDAQLATARFTSAISGGFLALIAVVMIIFYEKLYIDGHLRQLGILKAMGYSNGNIALRFWVFGLSVFIGTAFGFAAGHIAMPYIYDSLTIDTLVIDIHFHAILLIMLVFVPTIVYSLFACGYAYLALRRPVNDMLKGRVEKKIKKRKEKPAKAGKERSFLVETCFKTLGSKKLLAFFIAFACFCFSAMVQMGASMKQLSTESMGLMILLIGIVLAVTTMFMAVTSLIKNNVKTVSMMKVFGYSMNECALSVFGGYVPFAFLGFAVGTGYQYGLLSLMVNIVYKDVAAVPDYSFNVPVFFITLACFIVLYTAVMAVYAFKLNKVSVKEVMLEN
ncbi:MAG: FtsX-like permease family protein [Clostridia bacterium]|nr:FtsX-like permease family protein [Clostridia bacterium]